MAVNYCTGTKLVHCGSMNTLEEFAKLGMASIPT